MTDTITVASSTSQLTVALGPAGTFAIVIDDLAYDLTIARGPVTSQTYVSPDGTQITVTDEQDGSGFAPSGFSLDFSDPKNSQYIPNL
jgi:hypothetical protein